MWAKHRHKSLAQSDTCVFSPQRTTLCNWVTINFVARLRQCHIFLYSRCWFVYGHVAVTIQCTVTWQTLQYIEILRFPTWPDHMLSKEDDTGCVVWCHTVLVHLTWQTYVLSGSSTPRFYCYSSQHQRRSREDLVRILCLIVCGYQEITVCRISRGLAIVFWTPMFRRLLYITCTKHHFPPPPPTHTQGRRQGCQVVPELWVVSVTVCYRITVYTLLLQQATWNLVADTNQWIFYKRKRYKNYKQLGSLVCRHCNICT